MKLALIPPIELLEYTDMTNCQLMLPHLVKNDVYRYVYKKHCDDPYQYVILDNGVAEGEGITTGELLVMAHEYGVDEIVIPDVLGDAQATMNEYANFFDYARESESLKDLSTMYVIQGANEDDFYNQADFVTTGRFRASVIGIPRHALTTCASSTIRYELASYIRNRNKTRAIHLLGASPGHPSEMKQFRYRGAGSGLVRSTDTSSPFNYAYACELLHPAYAPISRPEGYFDLTADKFDIEKLDENVQKLLTWTRDA